MSRKVKIVKDFQKKRILISISSVLQQKNDLNLSLFAKKKWIASTSIGNQYYQNWKTISTFWRLKLHSGQKGRNKYLYNFQEIKMHIREQRECCGLYFTYIKGIKGWIQIGCNFHPNFIQVWKVRYRKLFFCLLRQKTSKKCFLIETFRSKLHSYSDINPLYLWNFTYFVCTFYHRSNKWTRRFGRNLWFGWQ